MDRSESVSPPIGTVDLEQARATAPVGAEYCTGSHAGGAHSVVDILPAVVQQTAAVRSLVADSQRKDLAASAIAGRLPRRFADRHRRARHTADQHFVVLVQGWTASTQIALLLPSTANRQGVAACRQGSRTGPARLDCKGCRRCSFRLQALEGPRQPVLHSTAGVAGRAWLVAGQQQARPAR